MTLSEIETRFDVLAKLGEGGMGCVYKVRHRDLDEVQIVKTLQAHLSGNEGLRNRFINEARRGMKLRHPHIAGVHDFQICADGTGYIVMEYVPGMNLNALLSVRGALPVKMVGTIAVQALDALGYLHDQLFVHRDISPDNLMLATTTDGRPFVKLIDLGIAKSLEAGQTMTATGQFLGKVHYASPEQFGGHLDGRSDLYSLGVVLYNLLTNSLPFTGENYREIISAHLFQPPRRFEEAAPDRVIPEAVQRVVYRALEKEPEKRYADADEFCAAVEEAFDVHDVRTTRSVTRPARTAPGATSGTAPTQVDTTIAADLDPAVDRTVVDRTEIDDARTVTPAAPTLVPPPTRSLHLPYPVIVALVLAIGVAIGLLIWQRMEAARLAAYGKFYAVVIGESSYRKLEPLPTAVADARAVAELLRSKYGFDVTLLENAGQQQILDALHASRKRVTDRDNLLVYYAGHGMLRGDKGYWQPVDADLEMNNWISPALLTDVLIEHPARRTLIIADSCYSGALVPGAQSLPQVPDRAEKRARLMISSGGDAPIIDSADGRHSIFTRALLDVLADPGRNAVDVQQLFTPIREQVVRSALRAGRYQAPELSTIAQVGDEGGTFFFVPKRR